MSERAKAKRRLLFEEERQKLTGLRRELELLPNWLPGRSLIGHLRRMEDLVGALRERLESKPVVAIVGPTGSGKSTLVNALARRDGLTETGIRRPTTRRITMVTRSQTDARQLLDRLSSDDLKVELSHASPLREAILLDTPDTDSMESAEYRDLLERTLGLADVLVCVFDAANPKRQDNLSVLANWVALFPGDDVLLVLNRCDRIEEKQLREDVLPDFERHVSDARVWEKRFEVFCVSARDRLEDPGWVEGESPLHGYNEFDKLEERLQGLGAGAFFADRRLKRTAELREISYDLVSETARRDVVALREAADKIKALRVAVDESGLESISAGAGANAGVVNVALWTELSRRWWGPIGLYAALVRKALGFWLPFRFVNFLNPLSFLPALLKSLRGLARSGEGAESGLLLPEDAAVAESPEARILIRSLWPEVADLLVEAGFDPGVRDSSEFAGSLAMPGDIARIWRAALDDAVGARAASLSGGFWQFLLNTPVFAGCGFVGYYLVVNFRPGSFLPLNFFLHALFLLALLWLVPGWLLHFRSQAALRGISVDARETARRISRESAEAHGTGSPGLEREVEGVLRLAGAGRDRV